MLHKKRIFAVLLTLVMLAGMVPQNVFAVSAGEDTSDSDLRYTISEAINEEKTKAELSLEVIETEGNTLKEIILPDGTAVSVAESRQEADGMPKYVVHYTAIDNGAVTFLLKYDSVIKGEETSSVPMPAATPSEAEKPETSIIEKPEADKPSTEMPETDKPESEGAPDAPIPVAPDTETPVTTPSDAGATLLGAILDTVFPTITAYAAETESIDTEERTITVTSMISGIRKKYNPYAPEFEVYNVEDWISAVQTINDPKPIIRDGPYVIKLMDDIDMQSLKSRVPDTGGQAFLRGSTRILGNGHTIKNIEALFIEDFSNVILGADDGSDTLFIDGVRTEEQKRNNLALPMISVKGRLNMYDGVTIANRVEEGTSEPGFVIRVKGTGHFAMYGGEIRDNIINNPYIRPEEVLSVDGKVPSGAYSGVVTILDDSALKSGLFRMYGGTIKNNTVSSSENVYGAAITSLRGNVEIQDSIIKGNTAKGKNAYGGGISFVNFDSYLNMRIKNTDISNNVAKGTENAYGGGIAAWNVSGRKESWTVFIIDSKITNNESQYGGGIALSSFGGDISDLKNRAIIANNNASVGGADFYLEGSSFLGITPALNMGQTFTMDGSNKPITDWYEDNNWNRWGPDHKTIVDPSVGIIKPRHEVRGIISISLIAAYDILSIPVIPKTGGITVTKTVSGSGGDMDKAFPFTVTLSNSAINGTFGELEFVRGVATFQLKHGESKTASGLPEETSYIVVEGDNDGYTVTKANDTGSIQPDVITAVTFKNHRDIGGGVGTTPAPVKSDPPVRKTVTGKPAIPGTFTFTLTPADPSFPMPEGSADSKKEVTVSGEGAYEFGDITFTNSGTYVYNITEKNNGESGYTYDGASYTVTYVVTDNSGKLKVARTIKRNGQAADDVIFTNDYKKAGNSSGGSSSSGGGKPAPLPSIVTPTISVNPAPPAVSRLDSVPKTEDTTNAALPLAFMIFSFTGLLLTITLGRRKRYYGLRKKIANTKR